MAAMKIGAGLRYQKTGSPSQKKARKIEEIMRLVINDALSSPKRKRRRQAATSGIELGSA
jgi:hypothetical protein